MGLLEVLRGRAARRGGTAQVDCGELGVLTVEALPPADAARFSGDSRALLYAACRELQAAGEALRSEGKIFRPDEITAYLTETEADAAAQTVLELSGLSEIRRQSVQGLEEGFSEIRPESVQGGFALADISAGADEIRRLSVQDDEAFGGGNGQVSREFPASGGNFVGESGTDKKSQILGDLSAGAAQIVVPQSGEAFRSGVGAGAEQSALHGIRSELRKSRQRNLHEIKSESGGRRGLLLHETESESEMILHEIESELQKALHEIKSEVREMLHETESELAEQAAQRLAEALRRAGQVR